MVAKCYGMRTPQTKHLSTQDKSDANDPASTEGLVQEAAETI